MVIFAKDIIAWTGKGINKLRNCENYELYGKIPVCKGMEKFSSILLEQPTDTGRMFDNGLFLAFVFGFFSFLVASMYTILVEESKSLKEISNKVIRTTDTIVTVLRTMWTLKVSKESNATLEQELIEINKCKVHIQPVTPYASHEKIKEEVISKESKGFEEIEYVEQIEFSLNDDWHPPKDEENKPYLAEVPPSDPIHDADENKCNKASPRDTNKHSSLLLKPDSGRSKLSDRYPNLQVLYEKKPAEAYSIHSRYNEASVSHVGNLRESRWSTTNSQGRRPIKMFSNVVNKDARRQHSPDYRTINRQPSRMSYLSYSSRKCRSSAEGSNDLPPTRGIFDQRRRDKARARRSNSPERNSVPMKWDMMSMSNNVKSPNLRNDKYSRDNRTSIMPEYSR